MRRCRLNDSCVSQDGQPRRSVDLVVLLIISILALLLRGVYAFLLLRTQGAEQFSDFLYMHQLAVSLADGDGFTIDGVRIFNQSVGYPFFLAGFYAVFGAGIAVALVVNSILGTIAVMFVVLLFRRYQRHATKPDSGTGPFAVLLCAALAIGYPDAILYTGLIASENLLIPVLLVLVWVNVPKACNETEQIRSAFVVGVLTGAVAAVAALIKANVLIYCLLLPLQWMLSRRRWLIRSLGAVIAGVCFLTPWTIANYRASGGHIIPFSAIAGTAFLDGTNPHARGQPTNRYQLDVEPDDPTSEIERNQLRLQQALSYIIDNPGAFVKLTALKLVHSFSPVRDFVYEAHGRARLFHPLMTRWLPTIFNGFMLVGVCLLLVLGDRKSILWLSGACLSGGAIVLQLVFFAYSRYRYPFLFALIPQGVTGWMLMLARVFPYRRADAPVGMDSAA